MGMAPQNSTQMSGGVKKFCQMTNLTMLKDVFSIKCALELVPGLVDVGIPHGDKNGPRTPAPGCRSKMHAYHVDQWGNLKCTWGGMGNCQPKGRIGCERM